MEPRRARSLAALVLVTLVASACGLFGPPPAPRVDLSTESVSLQAGVGNKRSATVQLSNDGDAVLNAQLSTDKEWLSVSPADVSVAAGESVPVTVSGQCGAAVAGPMSGTVSVKAGGKVQGTITVTLTCVENPPSEFDIEVVFFGDTLPTATQEDIFQQAAARWSQVIVGDLPDGTYDLAASECSAGHPAMPDLAIDDVVILAKVAPIDGVSGILGSAGPCIVRGGPTGLTAIGTMVFDSADVAAMELNGTLYDVVLHEMGHVLGVGTFWKAFGLLDGLCNPADTITVRRFIGVEANAKHVDAGGEEDNLVIEADGGAGTACGHWDEALYDDELMTGFVAGAGNPLSAITVGSLADLGYEVNYLAADDYTVPSPGVRALSASHQLNEVLLSPVGVLGD